MHQAVKRTLKWLFIAMCGAVLISAVLLVWIHTGHGRSTAADFLSGVLSRGERSVKITGLQFLLPQRLGFENLAVCDEKGQWLAVDDAFLKWDPWSVVRGRIHVLEVGARSIRISHAPEAASETPKGKPEASGGAPWNLLARVSISSASVDSFSIDEAVAGTAMSFSFDASLAQMEQTEQAVFSFDVNRLDGPGGHVRISASVSASARTLILDGQISDPAGGVVSTLAGRSVPVAVSISGDGPLSKWSGSLEGTAGDLGELSLYLTLKEQGDVFRFTGNGEAGVLSGLTGRPEPDLIKIAYDADFSRNGSIHVHDFRLAHPGVAFISKGMFEQAGGRMDGVFSLSVQDLGGLTHLEESGVGGGVEIEGKLGGTLNRPLLDAEVSGTGICAHDFSADSVSGKIRTVFDRAGLSGGALDFRIEAAGSGVVLPGAGSIPGDSVSVEADVRLTPDGAMSGQGNAAIGSWFYTTFSGSLSSGREVEATGRLEARDLSALSGLAGVPLAGASWMEFSIAGSSSESFVGNFKGSAEPELLTRLTGQSWPGGNLRLKGSVKLDENGKLYLTDAVLGDDAFHLSAVGSMFFPDRSFSGEINLHIDELEPFSSVSGTPLSGRTGFRMDFEGKTDHIGAKAEVGLSNVYAGGFRVGNGKIDLSASGRLSDIKGDLSVDLVSGAGRLNLSTGIRSNRNRIDLDNLLVNGPGGTVQGNLGFAYETELITGGLKFRIEDPGRFLESRLDGEAIGTIRFFNDKKQQKASVELTGSRLETAHGSISRLHAEGKVTGLFPPKDAVFACELADLKSGDLQVSVAKAEGKWNDRNISVHLNSEGRFHTVFSSGVSANFSDGPEQILTVSGLNHVHGGIPVNLGSPFRVVLAGQKISIEEASFSVGEGTLRGSGAVDRDTSTFSLDASCHRLPLALASVVGYEAGEGSISGKVNLSQWKRAPELTLDVILEGFRPPGRQASFAPVDMKMSVKSNENRVEASAEAELEGRAPLSLNMVLPVDYSDSTGLPSFAPAGKVEARLVWESDIEDVSALGVKMPGDFSGRALLEIEVQGTARSPEISGMFTVEEGAYRDAQLGAVIENAGVHFSARTISDRLALTGSVSGISSSPFEIAADLPFVFSLSPFHLAFPADGGLKGSLRGGMDLAAVPAALSLDRHYMQGVMTLDLDLAGTLGEPLLSGSAQLNRGYFEDITTGTVLEDISLRLEASPPRIEIVRGEARAGRDGKVEVGGWVEAGSGERISYDVTLEMDDAALLRRDDAYAVVDGSLRLNGTGGEAFVTGKVLLDRAEIMIPDRIANDIPRLEVVEIHGDRPVDPPAPSSEKAPSLPVNVDVSLESPGRLFVSGRGLDSEWKGTVHVEGKSPDLEVSGGFNLVRGYFNLLGKRFALTKGVIQLGGPAGAPPLVDVEGRASSGGMTAEVAITGPATSPSISLSSSPPYPSDEILARLLFGRSLDSLTPLQALQLAQAARTLAGGGGLDIFGRTRKLLGIDQLELMQSDENEGEASIRAGKYINDRIYLQVEQGVGSDSSRASVEVELSPNLSLETEMDAESGGGVGVKWRWDY